MRRPILLVVGVLLVCLAAMPAAGQDESTRALRLKALKAERLATLPQAAAAAIAAKTVVVDCAKGGSISAALANNTGPLVIKLRGTCRENVRIERNDLTLRGTDPARDGIQGVAANPQPNAALELWYSNRVVLENLFVTDSPTSGVGAWFSALEMRNCRIERNGGAGIHISAASGLTGTELVVSSSANVGIHSLRQGYVTCTGCRLENPSVDTVSFWGIAASSSGGVMTLWDTVVSGPGGIAAFDAGSYIDVDCVNVVSNYPCSINNTQGSVARAYSGGIAALWGVGAFTGLLNANGGEVAVYGGQQTRPDARPNRVSDFGRLTTGMAEDGGPTTTLGNTVLNRFAHAMLWDGTLLSETLVCGSGSDAWSDTPYPAAQVIGCANVPK